MIKHLLTLKKIPIMVCMKPVSYTHLELEKLGFQLSIANTDTSGGELGQSNRYVCYVNEDIQIVIENNHTKYFWIYFYKTGEWTLK